MFQVYFHLYLLSKWYAGILASLVMLVACFVSTSVVVVKHGYLTGLIDILKPGQ